MRVLPPFRYGPLLLLLLAGLAGCVEPYAPAVINAPPSLLVVDGFINAAGSSTIRLSRSASLDAKAVLPTESNARVSIEQQNGPSYTLTETTAGTYVSAPLTLPAGTLCRVRISTAKGQQYASDFVPVKLTPPIDELRWEPRNNVADILVSTHDDTRASQYYRWEYDQTWEISSPYSPNVEYFVNSPSSGFIRLITVPYPLVCWVSSPSSRIMLSKTTALSQDKVLDFRVQGVPAGSPELYLRYSILVRQQALTAEEYAYWEQLRKNTEALGTLFDPQPSQITGNVRSLDGNGNMALGFVGAHSVSEKRLFIRSSELPGNWPRRSGYESCIPPDTVFTVQRGPDPLMLTPAEILFAAFSSQRLLPIEAVQGNIGYLAKSRDCVDCRTRGTSVRPAFW